MSSTTAWILETNQELHICVEERVLAELHLKKTIMIFNNLLRGNGQDARCGRKHQNSGKRVLGMLIPNIKGNA